jgi:riboflavin transporter FmnP
VRGATCGLAAISPLSATATAVPAVASRRSLPLLISAFAFGTLPGVGIALLTVALSFLLGAEGGGPWGALMHGIAIVSYVATASAIYSVKKTQVWSLIGMIAGVLVMTALMIPANLFITPIYMHVDRKVVADLLLPGIIPVNLVKGAITALLTNLLYPYISPLLHGRGFAKKR